jgi:cell fate regulator YaaT (PSP1 superfamily)
MPADCQKNAEPIDTGLSAVLPGSTLRVVEAAWAVRPRSGRRFLLGADDIRFFEGDVLLVRTDRGDLLVRALQSSLRSTLPPEAFLRVLRRLSPSEAENQLARIESREQEGRVAFVDLARKHDVEMHLSDVEILQDGRILFAFTAPGRVDFRGLVRDLAVAMRARIELRQIGVRDEARCTGGLGPCGLPLCCSSFLRDFTAVTIRMAKVQGLVPNPAKVSGLCGRLMCCLAYEHSCYCEMQKSFPKVGAMVLTPKGEGKVKELQILRGTLKVSLGPGLFEEFPLADVQWKGGGKTSDASPVEDETDDPAELKGLED